MLTVVQKTIQDWKIIPTTDDTISLIGTVDGVRVQTSPIVLVRKGEVKTQNTHYILGEKQPGIWEIQLDMRRRKQTDTLRNYGVL
jgi:hypothetical protein